MALLDFIKRKQSSIPLFSFLASRLHQGYFYSRKDNLSYYKGWVFTCVRAIAEEVATIDLRLNKIDNEGNKERVSTHPVLELLNKVNGFMDMYTLFERLQSNLELQGNEYWYLEGTGANIKEIYPLRPDFITPLPDNQNYVQAYRYHTQGKSIDIPRENIIHFKNFNPLSDIVGMSTLHAARTAADTDFAAREYNKRYFDNSAMPGVILEYPDNLTPEDVQRIRESWEEDHGGNKRQFKTAIASGGLKIHPISTTQRDMEFIEQRKFSRDEILAIFRVPKTIIGILEDVNFASAKTANYVFALRTIQPKMQKIVNTLNEFLLPLYGDPSLKFEFANPVPEDKEQVVREYKEGILGGWLSINDVRRRENLPEIVGGDTVFTGLNLIPFGKPEEKPKSAEKPLSKMSNEITLAIESEIKEHKEEPDEEPKLSEELEMKGELLKQARDRRGEGLEKKTKQLLKELWNGQIDRAIEQLKEELDKKDWKLKKFVLLDKDKEVKATIDLFMPLFKEIVEVEGTAAYDFFGLEEDFDVDKHSIKRFLKRNTRKFADGVTAETTKQIRATIIAGLEQGEAIPELTKRIRDVAAFSKARAEKIARSEVIRAQMQSDIAVWKELNFVKRMIWYTALNNRVCDLCMFLHGTEIEISGSFVTESQLVGLGENVYDGDINAPPRHPNCACTLIPVVDSKSYEKLKEELRKELSEEQKVKLYLSTIE